MSLLIGESMNEEGLDGRDTGVTDDVDPQELMRPLSSG